MNREQTTQLEIINKELMAREPEYQKIAEADGSIKLILESMTPPELRQVLEIQTKFRSLLDDLELTESQVVKEMFSMAKVIEVCRLASATLERLSELFKLKEKRFLESLKTGIRPELFLEEKDIAYKTWLVRAGLEFDKSSIEFLENYDELEMANLVRKTLISRAVRREIKKLNNPDGKKIRLMDLLSEAEVSGYNFNSSIFQELAAVLIKNYAREVYGVQNVAVKNGFARIKVVPRDNLGRLPEDKKNYDMAIVELAINPQNLVIDPEHLQSFPRFPGVLQKPAFFQEASIVSLEENRHLLFENPAAKEKIEVAADLYEAATFYLNPFGAKKNGNP